MSVSPFHTGTPDSAASSSTTDCSYPLYSMPSKMRPSTFAVSAMLSFLPIWELLLSRNVTPAPSSIAATSNEHLVLVDVFSKSRTMFFPSSELPLIPSLFLAFRSCARSSRYLISAGVKSISVRKLLPLRFTAIIPSYRSSLLTGHDMHLGPPLPLESSELGIVSTSMPFLSSRSFVT